MVEGFAVDAEHIRGYANLVDEITVQLSDILTYIHEHGDAGPGFDGIMSELAGPVNTYAWTTAGRLGEHNGKVMLTATNLRNASEQYSGIDVWAGEKARDAAGDAAPPSAGHAGDAPQAVSYPVTTNPSDLLQPPDIAPPPIGQMVEQVGGSLQGIDWVLETVFGWSPVEAITKPISGNWNSLAASGDVLIKSGNALEKSLSNLTESIPRLQQHWSGGAAQAFGTYLHNLVDGIGQEAPLSRLVGEAYKLIATQIEKVAQFVIDKLKWAVDQILEKAATGWIPFYGWAKIVDFIRQFADQFEQAKAMVDKITDMVRSAQALLNAAENPRAAAEALGGKVQAVSGAVGKAQTATGIAKDAKEVSNVEEWEQMPDNPYSTSPGNLDPRRPGA